MEKKKTSKYKWMHDVAPCDKVKFVGDAGEYYVAGMDYNHNKVMIMGGARNEQWCRLDQLRLIERNDERLTNWFKYNAGVDAYNIALDALRNSFCLAYCPNLDRKQCEMEVGCLVLAKFNEEFDRLSESPE